MHDIPIIIDSFTYTNKLISFTTIFQNKVYNQKMHNEDQKCQGYFLHIQFLKQLWSHFPQNVISVSNSVCPSVCPCDEIHKLVLSSACCLVCVFVLVRRMSSFKQLLHFLMCRPVAWTPVWLTALLTHSDSSTARGWESVRPSDLSLFETKEWRTRPAPSLSLW